MRGLPVPILSYEVAVALALNFDRMDAKLTDRVRNGVIQAMKPSKMPKAYYEHLTDDPREAYRWYAADLMAGLDNQMAEG